MSTTTTTTQILFNSPALHSLKREQLVKLCKIHSIKANGKNVDLIQKLRQHAQTLPKDSPLSIAARSEEHGPVCPPVATLTTDMETDEQDDQYEDTHDRDDDEDTLMGEDPVSHYNARARPSEQWEMVMDSIAEEEETGSSQGTMSSQRTLNMNGGATGEFGTASSKSSGTVSSSIKALATSLGLKRSGKSTPASTASSKHTLDTFPPPLPIQEAMDELTQMSTPYSDLPEPTSLPQTDHFTLDASGRISLGGEEDPLPGHALRPGIPAPSNARLSMGLGSTTVPSTPQPTTTIRLVSNPLSNTVNESNQSGADFGTPQLRPFHTTFDITFGSPAPTSPSAFAFGFGSGVSTWPPLSPGGDDQDVQMKGIYPTLTFSDLPPTIEVKPKPTISTTETTYTSAQHDEDGDGDVAMPGSLTFAPTNSIRQLQQLPSSSTLKSSSPSPLSQSSTPIKSPLLAAPATEPFVFGTPIHRVSNAQFSVAAASVLEEMNQRLREQGVDELGSDILSKLHPGSKPAGPPREIKPIPGSAKRGEITNKFDKLHQQEFNKMEGIDSFVKRRALRLGLVGAEEEQDKEPVVLGKKRKSNAIEAKPRKSSVVPRQSRVSGTRVISNGRRAKALPGAFGVEDDEEDEDAEERGGKRVRMDPDAKVTQQTPEELEKERQTQEERRVQLEKEKEVIKRKLEVNRARRRSSAANAGGGLAARRKSGRVSGVGASGPRASLLGKQKSKPSRFGFLSSAKNLVQSVWNRGKTTAPAATSTGAAALTSPSNIPKPVARTASPTGAQDKGKATDMEGKGRSKMGPPSILPKKAGAAPAKATTTSATATSKLAPPTTNKLVKLPSASSSTTASRNSVASTSMSSRARSPLPSFNTPTSAEKNGTATSRSSLLSAGTAGTSSSKSSSRMSSIASSRSRTSSSLSTNVHNVSSIGTRLSKLTPGSTSNVGSMGTKSTTGRASVAARTSVSNAAAGSGTASSRVSRMSTSSRLFAPTASSLAKMNGAHGHTRTSSLGSLKEDNGKPSAARKMEEKKPALTSITNSPALTVTGIASPKTPVSPGRPGGIFSKPIAVSSFQSGIPTPVKKRTTGDSPASPASVPTTATTTTTITTKTAMSTTTATRQRSLNGRKPRISRSKVIAKLSSQRQAGGPSSSSGVNATPGSSRLGVGPRRSSGMGKTRSSLGAKVSKARASYGGGSRLSGAGGRRDSGLVISAKRKVRQSEYYARRRSSRVQASVEGDSSREAMEA